MDGQRGREKRQHMKQKQDKSQFIFAELPSPIVVAKKSEE
jgi:hypothetical protein